MIHRSVILSEAENLIPLTHVLNSVEGVSSMKSTASIRAVRRGEDNPRPYGQVLVMLRLPAQSWVVVPVVDVPGLVHVISDHNYVPPHAIECVEVHHFHGGLADSAI